MKEEIGETDMRREGETEMKIQISTHCIFYWTCFFFLIQ